MKTMRIATIAIFILLSGMPAQAGYMRSYAYAWPLTLAGDSAAWQIEPTAEIYAAISDAQLRDLEVVDGDGNPVPMAQRAAESTGAAPLAYAELPLFALPAHVDAKTDDGSLSLRIERGADGRLRSLDAGLGAGNATISGAADDFIIDASKLDAPIDSLRLDWDEVADAVNAQFALVGSDDLQTWRNLVANASVLALNQAGNRLSRHEIALGGVRVAYLRLHRLDHGAALRGLRVSARSLAPSSPVRAARQWLAANPTANEANENPPPAMAIYRYVLPAALPVEALRLELASDNSIARVRIASRAPATTAWIPRGDFTAFRLNTAPQSLGESLIGNDEVAINAAPRNSEWRVEASPPLDRAPTLNLAWRPDRFVFLAQGQGPYRLIAGSANVRRAEYPVDIALAQLRGKLGQDWQPPLAQLGARDTLSGADAFKPVVVAKPHDWKTWLLWGVLIGAAALIGGLALSLLRKPKA
ncbi:MAG TPA: DUF3999 domain-containing protein [Rudaea sp.]|jgi:hypothetical protein|uniref:DUF3999 domain-containing protein n=1 Tax=Rudaea sp. TaxID=2136325 RepID=UPI002F942343